MSVDQPAYEAVADLLRARAGLTFPDGRRDSAEVGIRRAMARAGVTNPERYRELIARDSDALDDLLVELTVGETYFFREPGQFAFIRREVLPDLARRCGGDTWVRAWSAGCASGEEPYSLAILFEEEGVGQRNFLLATDVSRTALAKSAPGGLRRLVFCAARAPLLLARTCARTSVLSWPIRFVGASSSSISTLR